MDKEQYGNLGSCKCLIMCHYLATTALKLTVIDGRAIHADKALKGWLKEKPI